MGAFAWSLSFNPFNATLAARASESCSLDESQAFAWSLSSGCISMASLLTRVFDWLVSFCKVCSLMLSLCSCDIRASSSDQLSEATILIAFHLSTHFGPVLWVSVKRVLRLPV